MPKVAYVCVKAALLVDFDIMKAYKCESQEPQSLHLRTKIQLIVVDGLRDKNHVENMWKNPLDLRVDVDSLSKIDEIV